ncbi:MAG: VOC family protein [Pseudomonadota bacterium]
MQAMLEHTNYSVSDAPKTAAWMQKLFGWHVRWEGDVLDGRGYSMHVGTESHYVAIYADKAVAPAADVSQRTIGGLNHLAVVVDDLDATEAAVRAHGFETGSHADYEPGRRFYFHDHDGIQWEVVSYD